MKMMNYWFHRDCLSIRFAVAFGVAGDIAEKV